MPRPKMNMPNSFIMLFLAWFGPKETEVIRQFYEGAEGTGVPWAFWIKPLVLWTPFLLAVYFIFLCMNVIIRRQWTDREKLTFPLVSLPLKITMNAEPSWHFNRFSTLSLDKSHLFEVRDQWQLAPPPGMWPVDKGGLAN